MFRRTSPSLLLALVLGVGLVLAPGSGVRRVAAVDTPAPVTMQASITPSSVLPAEAMLLTAMLAVENPPDTYVITGTVEVYETTGGGEDLVGSGSLSYTGNPTWNTATIALPGVEAGTHTYQARFAGSDTLASANDTVSIIAGLQSSWLDVWFDPNPVLHTQHATAKVALFTTRNGMDPTGGLPPPTGTLTLKTYPGGTVVGTTSVSGNGQYGVPLPLYPSGTRQFTFEYSGDANFSGTTSEPETLTIQADTVQVSGVGVQYSTFYPYRDNYRDTVAIRGTRLEAASIAISIYNPNGKRIRTASIAAGSGAWSWAWNGRKSSGDLLAEGKHKVVQVITDAASIKKTVTSYVTLSHKRLVVKSATFTKDHTQAAQTTDSWLAWNFKLPSAAVYKSLTFSIYGKDSFGGGGFGPHDYSWCVASGYHPDCVTRWRSFPDTFRWKSVSGSVTLDRSGRSVRLYAWGGFGDTKVSKGRVEVRYAILR